MNYDIGVVTQRRVISPAESYFAIPATVEGAAAWHDLYNQAIVTDNTGWVDYTIRQGIAVAAYDALAPSTGTFLRVTMNAASSTGVVFSQAWIGHVGVGDLIDFDGTQVQLLFSGNPNGSIGAGGTLVSDAKSYAFDKTKALVISVHFSGASDVKSTTPLTNFTGGWAYNPGESFNYVSLTDIITSSFDTASRLYCFGKVEVFG